MATADFSPSQGRGTTGTGSQAAGAILQGRLSTLTRRRNTQKMVRALVRSAIPGVSLAAASVLLYKLHIIPDGPWWAPPAMIGAFLLWGFRSGRMQRAGSFSAARDADLALDLNDHLSSAFSFVAPTQVQHQTRVAAQKGVVGGLKSALFPKFALSTAVQVPPTNLVPALVDEAAERAQKLDPKRVYPLPFDRKAQVLAVLGVLFVGFVLMPDMPVFQTAAQKKQVAAMQQAGEKLVAVAKTVQKNEPPKAEEVQQLSRRLEKLGQKMMRGRMTKRAALTEMGELREKLEKAKLPPKNSGAQSQGMPQIAEALRQAPLQSQAGRKVQQQLAQNKWDEAAKELEKLADKIEKGELSEAEKQKAADDLEKTARDLRSRGGEANKKAADQLQGAANQLRQKQQPQEQQGKQGDQQKQQQGQQGQQDGQGEQKSGQQKQGQEQGQQGQQGQQGGQKQGQQQQGKEGQQQGGQQGGEKGQQGQKQQSGQQGQQQQQQQGGQQGGQSGGQQQQQQQQGQQGGQQGGQGQQSPGQGQQGGDQGAAGALRDMANGLRQGGSSGGGQGLQDMMNKLREAENQTGTNGGQQFGQGKPGQGGGNGGSQGQMKGVTPGKDIMPSDPHGQVGGGAGMGPRNNAQGVQSGGGVSKLKSNRTGDKRRYQDAWADSLPKTRKKIDRVTGKWGDSGEVEQMPTRGEAKGGEVKTPYYEVYESRKRDMEDAVGRDTVPPAYKQPVKDYFESIKP